MQVNLHHSVIANSGSRAEVSTRPSDAKDPQSELVLQVATPKTSSTFGRRLLNTLTLGYYTKHVSNPAQWRAFRNAMMADLRRADPSMDEAKAKGTVQRLRGKVEQTLGIPLPLRTVHGYGYAFTEPLLVSSATKEDRPETLPQDDD